MMLTMIMVTMMLVMFNNQNNKVIVTDRHKFETGLLDVDINVEEAVEENFEVRVKRIMDIVKVNKQVNLKINNLNIEDIFDWQRMERLKKVFQDNLWQEAHQVMMFYIKDKR